MSEELEYASTGRARCKLCKEPIAKDALRMSITVQSFQFDGDMVSWHHAICAAGRRPTPMLRAVKKFKKLPAPTKGVLESLAKLAEKRKVKRYVWRHPDHERCIVELAGNQFALFTELTDKHLFVEGSLDEVLASVPDEDFEAAVTAAKNAGATVTATKSASTTKAAKSAAKKPAAKKPAAKKSAAKKPAAKKKTPAKKPAAKKRSKR